jgi:hypothetical protein
METHLSILSFLHLLIFRKHFIPSSFVGWGFQLIWDDLLGQHLISIVQKKFSDNHLVPVVGREKEAAVLTGAGVRCYQHIM